MRARIYYSKGNPLKFTGALDLQAIWQRSLRRAGLSVELSQGFHPQPKIQLPFPLPLGFTAQNEIIDIWFAQDYAVDDIRQKLAVSLPVGIEIQLVEPIDGQKKSIASSATFADFKVSVDSSDKNCDELKGSLEKLLERQVIMRERNNKQYDLRPLIFSIQMAKATNENCLLEMRLSAHPSSTGRPDEVMKELGLDLAECEIERLGVHFEI
jgi:radical SAM-linked protein